MMEKVARMHATTAERERVKRAEEEAKRAEKEAKIIPLPIWPSHFRGVPNGVLRSALFGAIKRGPRSFQDNVIKSSLNGLIISHTGPQLDQADLDVWEQCLHFASIQGVENRLEFTAYSFLKAIGRATGGRNSEWLMSVFRRLAASVVQTQDEHSTYAGPLIHHLGRDEKTGRHIVQLNPNITRLYKPGWTQIDWDQRNKLRGHPLAQWLHGFYSTHAEPYPMKVETLHKLSGSEAKKTFHFREELRDALTKLNKEFGWSYEIDNADLLHLNRTPTLSQTRHLIRKATKDKKPNKPKR
ncbi:MAG: Replication initiator protein A [Chromatium okenii]|nr:Replication initiator protein A [Chromatium okenii]